MKIFFEDFAYKSSVVKPYLDNQFLIDLKNERSSIPYVGYYYSKDIDDTVFILPKVFIKVCDTVEKAFGEFDPEKIFDTKDNENPLLKSGFKDDVFGLSTWIYRAIVHYIERNPSRKTEFVDIQNVQSDKGSASETWIDIILRLIRFNNEHQQLFTYIARTNSQGNNKISWNKTINHIIPILQDGAPVYMRFVNKTKTFNLDEELLVLFYSVMDYLQEFYNIKIRRSIHYQTDIRLVERLIGSKRGVRLLRTIRHKYYKDELVELWNLLNVFFQKADEVASNRTYKETLMVRDFNNVFEDMIDSLISDDTMNERKKLKDQPDGKIVDHIYSYESLMQSDDIYYVGDSKYYKEGNAPDEYSIFKQFTYVRNVIQMNMELWKVPHGKIGRANYYDSMTEGYNISPNFFIRGLIEIDKTKADEKGRINYNNIYLKPEKKLVDGNEVFNVESKIHHPNRLFDRDTLFVQKYSINFLYVLTEYAASKTDPSFQKRIHKLFRRNIIEWLKNHYSFYQLEFDKQEQREDFLNRNFRKLIGKLYHFDDTLILALSKDSESEDDNDDILNNIIAKETYCRRNDYSFLDTESEESIIS